MLSTAALRLLRQGAIAVGAALVGLGCANDLSSGLFGRACSQGRCVAGFECVEELCVPKGTRGSGPGAGSSGTDTPVRMAVRPEAGRGPQLEVRYENAARAGTGGTRAAVPVETGARAGNASISGRAGGSSGGGAPSVEGGSGGGGAGMSGAGGMSVAAGGDGGSAGSVDTGPCGGLAACGAECPDLRTDPRNCGGCGRACASVERCIEGICRSECGPYADPILDAAAILALACPEPCDACEAGACIFRCSGEQACKDRRIGCPLGFACRVECSAKQACEKLQVRCAAGQLCSMQCDGEQACTGSKLDCAGAHCELLCGEAKESCKEANLSCSAGTPCRAQCPARDQPKISGCSESCNGSCGC